VRRYLLDSAPLAAFIHGRPGATQLITPWIRRREAATSVLAHAEVIEYLLGFQGAARLITALRRSTRQIYPYDVNYPVQLRYAEIRRRLRPPSGPGLIGDIDTFMAAVAIEWDLIVVTTDTDFQRVPDLKVVVLSRESLR
jgi:predicted nucleic acid-binding protein